MSKLNLSLAVALVLALIAALFLGSVPMAHARIFAALTGGGEAGDAIILWQVRLPRSLAAALVARLWA